MTKMNLVLIAAMGLVGVAGCGGGDEGVAFTEDEYCNQRAAGECAALAGGCTFGAADTAACTPKRKDVCVKEAAAVKSPKRVFNEGRGKTCVAESKKVFTGATLVPIASWQMLQETCSRTFGGELKLNDVCTISLDCIPGLICDKGACSKANPVAAGAGCANAGDQCGAGQYCTSVPPALPKCENRIALDQPCDASKLCGENLRCLGSVCKEKVKMGEPCASDSDCPTTLICEPFVRKCSTTINLATQCTVLGAGGGGMMMSTDAAVGG